MIGSVEDYLGRLEKALRGADPAVVQDALADAEDHLRTDIEHIQGRSPSPSSHEALNEAVRKYGGPEETAAAYREMESRFPSSLPTARPISGKRGLARFFGIYAQPRAWGSFLYMLLSGLTGIVYGAWALVGGTVAMFSMLFVIGIPFAALFLLTVRGIVLLDGRLVEALLGVRMPRRPLFLAQHTNGLDRLKALFTDRRTWKALLYLILHFPIGLLYLGLSAGILSFSLSFTASPILELIFHLPLDLIGTDRFTPIWLLPFVCLAGIILTTLLLHGAGWIGRMHARYARAMILIRRKDPSHV